jgi:hypothetical protein
MQARQLTNVGHGQLIAPQTCKISQSFGHSRVPVKPGYALGACATLATFDSAQPHLEPYRLAKHRHLAHRAPMGAMHLITASIAFRTINRGICLGHQKSNSICSTVEIPHPKTFPERKVEIIILHESGELS